MRCCKMISRPLIFIFLLSVINISSAANVYDWTGYYAGLNLGFFNQTMDVTDVNSIAFNATIQENSNLKATGGFQIGYRRQLDLTKTSGVFGVEFSANLANSEFNKTYGSAFALYELQSTHKLNDFFLLQVSGGIAADRTLLFLTAGASLIDISGQIRNLAGAPFIDTFNLDKSVLGGVIGAGVEYAITDQLSARFKVDFILPQSYSTTNGEGNSFRLSNTITVGSLGLNYQFS